MVRAPDRLWVLLATSTARPSEQKIFGPFDGYNAAAAAQVSLATEYPDFRFLSRPLRDPDTAAEVLS